MFNSEITAKFQQYQNTETEVSQIPIHNQSAFTFSQEVNFLHIQQSKKISYVQSKSKKNDDFLSCVLLPKKTTFRLAKKNSMHTFFNPSSQIVGLPKRQKKIIETIETIETQTKIPRKLSNSLIPENKIDIQTESIESTCCFCFHKN